MAAAAVSPAALAPPSRPPAAPPPSPSPSFPPSPRAISRIFRSSLQTFRHVTPTPRKGKEKEGDTVSQRSNTPDVSPPPSAFLDRLARPSATRKSFDNATRAERQHEIRASKEKPREPPPRRSIDALTQNSASTSFSQGTHSTSDRDKRNKGEDNTRDRPRVLRKQPSSSSKRRPGAESPGPYRGGLSSSPEPSRSAGLRRLLSPIQLSHLHSDSHSQSNSRTSPDSQFHLHSRFPAPSPVPRISSPPSPAYPKPRSATGTPDRDGDEARTASPYTEKDAESDTDRDTGPTWSPFIPPTLSKGTMSSPTLVALRDAAERDYDLNHERSGGYDAKHARERVGKDSRRDGRKDTTMKQPQTRRQRSPLTSIGAFLPRAKKPTVASVTPVRPSNPSLAPTQSGSGSHILPPTSHAGRASLDATRVMDTPSTSTPTPGPSVLSSATIGTTSESARTKTLTTNGNSSSINSSLLPVPAPAKLPISAKTKMEAGTPRPPPLVISRPRGLGSGLAGNGPGTDAGNGHTSHSRVSSLSTRAQATRTPSPPSTPKTSRLIGIGHPSTSHRRSVASASTSHLPSSGTPSTSTHASTSASTTNLGSSSAPAAGLTDARSISPPRRARSPTASTSASRARERERTASPTSRTTSPTTRAARATSPAPVKRATSPTSGRASSPTSPTSIPPTASRTASPAARRPSGIASVSGAAKASALGMRNGKGSISASHLPLSPTGSTSQSHASTDGRQEGLSAPALGPIPTPGSSRLVPRRASHGHSSSVPVASTGFGSELGTTLTSTRTPATLLGSVDGVSRMSGALGRTAAERIRSESATSLVASGLNVSSSPEESGVGARAAISTSTSVGGGEGRGGNLGSGVNGSRISLEREIIRRATGVLVKEMVYRRTAGSGSAELGITAKSRDNPGTGTNTSTASAAGAAAYSGTPTKPTPLLSKDAWEAVDARIQGLVRLDRIWKRGGGESGGAGGVTEEKERKNFGDALKDGYVLCQLLNVFSPAIITRPDPSATSTARAKNIAKFTAAAVAFGVPPEEVFERHDFEGGMAGMVKVAGCVVAIEKVAGRKRIGDKAEGEGMIGKIDAKTDVTTAAARGVEAKRRPVITPSTQPTPQVASKSSSSTAVAGPATSVYTTHPVGSASTPNLLGTRVGSPSGSPSVNANVDVGHATSQTTPSVQGVMKQKQVLQIQKQKHQKRWSPPGLPTLRSASPVDEGRRVSGESEREMVLENGDDVFGPMEFVDGTAPISFQRTGARSSTASSQATDTTNAYSSLFDHRSSMHTRYGTIPTVTTDATSLGTDPPSLTRTEASALAADLDAATAGNVLYRPRSAGAIMPSGGGEESPRRRDRKVSDGLGVADLSRVAEETDEGSVGRRAPAPAPLPRPPSRDRSPPIRLGKGKWPDDFMNAFQYPMRGSPPQIPEGGGEGERKGVDNPTSLSGSPPRQRVRRPSTSVDLTAGASSEAVEPILPLGRLRRRSSRHSVDVLLPKEIALAIGRDSSPPSSRDSSTPSPGPTTSGGSRQPALRRSSTRNYAPRTTSPGHDRSTPEASVPVPVPFPRSKSGEHSPLTAHPSSSGTLHGELAPGALLSTAGVAARPPYQRARHRSEMDKRSSFDDQPAQRLARRSRFESMVNLGGTSDVSKGETSLIGGMDGSAVRQCLVVKEEGKPLTRYQLGNCIGRGQFGSVYRALNLNTGEMVAVKRIRLEGLSETEVAQLTHEVEIVKRLSHPSIVKYEGMAKDSDTLSIVLEYVENGSLAQTLKTFGKLDESLVASYVTKVLEGLDYLHRSQVVHCDLKAANILTTKTGNVKLSDFGVSLNLRVRAMEEIKNDIAGTPNWMAPEVIELKGASPASDIWSLACTIIELLTGRPPYADVENGMSVMFRIVEDPMPPIPKGFSEPLQDFLKLCFSKDPLQRPNAEMLCEHPWLKNEWGIHKELRPQDSIPFLRRVSADLHRSDVRHLVFVEDDSASSPRSSNGFTSTTEFQPRPHTFVKSTFSQAVTCRVCNQPVRKSAVFCTECSLISHPKCAADAPQTCDMRTQVIRLSQDFPREVVRQQSPPPNPVNNSVSSSPPKQVESLLSSSPPDRFRIFGRKKSKNSVLVGDATEPSKSPMPPVAFRYDDAHPTKRTTLSSKRDNNDNRSRSRGSIASSHQSSSMRSAVTVGSLSPGEAGGRARPASVAESDHRPSVTGSSLSTGVQGLMNAGVREEAPFKRNASRREKREEDSSRSGCIII